MNLNIKQCRNCGRLFESFGNALCNDCTEEFDKCYLLVRDYIYAHPDAEIAEISQKTGVKEKYILDFLKEQRLTLSGTTQSMIACEFCGRPIQSGRYCLQCIEKLGQVFDKASNSVRSKGSNYENKVENSNRVKDDSKTGSSLYRHVLKNTQGR